MEDTSSFTKIMTRGLTDMLILQLLSLYIWNIFWLIFWGGTYGLIYTTVQEDMSDKKKLRLNGILGRRPIIYAFPCQLLISSWPQHSTTYIGLKGQAGHVVTAVFINLAHMNVAPNRRQETEQ